MTRKCPLFLKEAGGSVLFINPIIRMIEEKQNGPMMEAVASLVSVKMAKQRMAEERQVSNKIKDFMADEFILEPERTVDHFFVIQHNGVVQIPS